MKKGRNRPHAQIDFDLRHLEVFKKVVESRSFSKAAKALKMAQPSVSERVSNLEKMVGMRLLDRLGRNVVPTKAGELVFKHAVTLLQMKRAACMEIQAFLGLKQGEVHIGGSTIPGEYVLPKLFRSFREKFPFVSVRLAIANSHEIQDRVLHGEMELGVVGFKPSASNLDSYGLWKDDLLLAVPTDHPLSAKSCVDLDELFEEPFVLREKGSGTLKIIEERLKARTGKGIESLRIAAKVGTSSAVKECVKAGVGVSILSSEALETELEMGLLRALRIRDLPLSRTFYLVRDKRRTASPQCQAMFDFLLSTAEEE
ncbi:MAG: LysR family transcriptional regulator [Deltaproteobacteria bacterium]|nr:LysR family transcriptional regulator [Deltaproteobacteria bacterium]MBW2136766.1 LysR family transcriptional regulator [Deltaproteobacteria bacterium]